MTVYFFVVGLRGNDLGNRMRVSIDDTGKIHHFRKTQNPGMVKETVHILVVKVSAAFIQGRSRHTRGNHKPHIHRKVFRGTKHIVDAGSVHYVGNLVGVGDDGGGAVGNDCPGKFRGTYQAGFQVNMGINKAGTDDTACHIHFLNTFVLP